ncbi:hypothetical protein PUW25_26020 (plasmid) [Paenibacillus urinalis]|uniref:Uncharacterized protein n=1 Tax=Paenibacillus urinalis TaxID=521520 RepID=A0ABY7XGW2_9BACL|nr:hypothetical protein [Paenibacillus urinalis]WDI05028.1 hypothetical protein PUW25_26020 [Paenibacillus urinalis]
MNKPLPQFDSLDEAVKYYEKYGELIYFGRSGLNYEYCVYNYRVRDGRLLRMNIYNDGRVELRE